MIDSLLKLIEGAFGILFYTVKYLAFAIGIIVLILIII